MNATDNTDAPKRRIEDHTPDAKLDWTKPDAPAVPAAPVAPRPVPLRAVASMSVSDEGFSFFATPAAKMLEPGHYMLSAAGAVLPQVGTGAAQLQAAAPAAPAVPVIDAPRVGTPRVDALMAKWEDDGATRGSAFCELRDLARELELAAPIARQAQPTDISRRLREYAANNRYSHNDYADTMRQAADEIERYYGGMLAWKQTAEKKDRDWNEERMARVNDRIAAREQPTGRDAWISVDERLPDGECLAVYVTPKGKQHRIRAKYVRQFQVEAEGDDSETEYNDDDDTFYIKAGWLECIDNWGEYSSCYVVEGTVTHWMPLPAAPALKSGSTTEGAAS